MNRILEWFTPARRKATYDTVAALNAAVVAIVPSLVALGVMDDGAGAKALQVAASVMAVAALLIARKNVPSTES